jgi:hypothetical protein
MKYFIIIVFLLLGKLSFACQCPVTDLSDKELNKYDLIFKGKIQTIKLNKEKSEAMFLVEELYKGNTAPTFKILFNDLDNCKLELRAGDEWIIYTSYRQIDNAKLDFCSRSRKYFEVAKEDFFAVTTGISYDEELHFLQTKLGLHKLLKDNPNKVENRNVIPSSNQFIIIIICSIAGVLMIYVIVNKLFKKYS